VYQIYNGISPSALEAHFHTTALTFYDTTHTAATGPRVYWCPGDPGMSTAIKTALRSQIGKTFGFFLHRGLQVNGSNTTYAISGIFFARIMAVELTGGPNAEGFIIQPVGYTDNWVMTSPDAPSTDRTLGRLRLVR
ncbi:MAG: hypothetical protein QUV05_12190, partial [Phycisphaerae bacterium]|nr:hypothetical protein [Phycisphaerae bacterium]